MHTQQNPAVSKKEKLMTLRKCFSKRKYKITPCGFMELSIAVLLIIGLLGK